MYVYIYITENFDFLLTSLEFATLLSLFFSIKLFLFSPNLTMSETLSL